MYSIDEVKSYIHEEDVKFIRLAFCDINGKQKNISIMPDELDRAFANGISIDASAIDGFGDEVKSDLFLIPDPSTLAVLPWRPQTGRVVRMLCNIKNSDGSRFEADSRAVLKDAVAFAEEKGIYCWFGSEFEFYLFKTGDDGEATDVPLDTAGYMDIAPEDRGENVRRDICLSLAEMGISPESSHHEEGPGQNEIDFKYSDALSAADNALTFISVVKAIAMRNGLSADFSPKPIKDMAGNGMHINISVENKMNKDCIRHFMGGIIEHIEEMTAFLNPTEESYMRLGKDKAPKYISWSPENRSQLIRIPASPGQPTRIELRSPDPMLNPYIAYALLIYAGVDGIVRGIDPGEPVNCNMYHCSSDIIKKLKVLPDNLTDAKKIAYGSSFISSKLPSVFLK